MRFLIRNLHIFVFALFSISAAVWVASDPNRTAAIVRPMVEDAIELQDLAKGAYQDVQSINWQQAYDEFVTLYVAAMRMPSLVFEKLAERLDKVNDDLSKRAENDQPLRTAEPRHAYVATRQADASAMAIP